MQRSKSRKLLSRILWFEPEAMNEGSPVEHTPDEVQYVPVAEPAAAAPNQALRTPERRAAGSDRAWFGSAPRERAGPKPADLYTEHFGLAIRPFALTPDPDFLFWPPAHARAYTILEYGVRHHAPITLITGEVGAGKTTLLLHLVRSLGPEFRVGLVSNPHGSRAELLRWVLHSLEQPAELEESYVDLFSRFQSYILSEYSEGRSVVLIFDEAQNLSAEALEELRMFININSGKDEVLQLVLIGQPELRDMVSRPNMRQFAQRVAASYHLTAMDLKTVRAYIPHRLGIAGCQRRLFTPAAVNLIFGLTKGVPRLVNQLCDLSLVYAYTRGKVVVGKAALRQILDDGVFFAAHADNDKGEISE